MCSSCEYIVNVSSRTMLCADSIEANVENASVHVEEGVTQLQRAKEYQVSICVTARDISVIIRCVSCSK